MLDPDFIRNNHEVVAKKLDERGYDKNLLYEFINVDKEWRNIKQQADNKRAEKNKLSTTFKEFKNDEEKIKTIKNRIKEIDKEIRKLEEKEKELFERRYFLLLNFPNMHLDDVPIGKDENDNVEIKIYGKPKKTADNVKAHYELPYFDFERAAKISGHRFAILYGEIAKLERALINYMLNLHVMNGYKEVWLPHLVLEKCLYGTGQLPKFKDDLYSTNDNLWLIPTAEVPLVNIFREEIIDGKKLPIRLCAYTPCYRREAGAYGKDIKGFIRQHQFDKVELVSITKKEESIKEHEKMLKDAESVLQGLDLPYRVIKLCSGDLGFSSACTYDIEVWFPSQNAYREVSSVSNCLDFQARRANIRYRDKNVYYAHTLNGSGLAVGRTLIAVIENYQEKDGIKIPQVLRSYFDGDFIYF